MSYLPTDDKARKSLPLFQQLVRYFPKTLREVTKVSVVNNVRYNPERDPADINWNRGKSPDQFGSAFRHMLEHAVDGKIYDDVDPEIVKRTGIKRIYVLAQAVWRLSAACEEEIERMENSGGPKVGRATDPVGPGTDSQKPRYCSCGMVLLPTPAAACLDDQGWSHRFEKCSKETAMREGPYKGEDACACGEWPLPPDFPFLMTAHRGTVTKHSANKCQLISAVDGTHPFCACGSVALDGLGGSVRRFHGKVHGYYDCIPESKA